MEVKFWSLHVVTASRVNFSLSLAAQVGAKRGVHICVYVHWVL